MQAKAKESSNCSVCSLWIIPCFLSKGLGFLSKFIVPHKKNVKRTPRLLPEPVEELNKCSEPGCVCSERVNRIKFTNGSFEVHYTRNSISACNHLLFSFFCTWQVTFSNIYLCFLLYIWNEYWNASQESSFCNSSLCPFFPLGHFRYPGTIFRHFCMLGRPGLLVALQGRLLVSEWSHRVHSWGNGDGVGFQGKLKWAYQEETAERRI